MPTDSVKFQFTTPLGKSLAKLIYEFDPFKEFDFTTLEQQLSYLSIDDLKTLKDYAKFHVEDSRDRLSEMRNLVGMTTGNTLGHLAKAFVMHQRFYIIQTKICDLILKKFNEQILKNVASQFCLFDQNQGLSVTLNNDKDHKWSYFSNTDTMQNLM